MSIISQIDDIGSDADLITRTDEWLENERIRISMELEKCSKELRAIQLAQQIKLQLQQKNLVAVQQILRDNNGDINNIIVRIVSLSAAMNMLESSDTLDVINSAAQLHGWNKDGYDIQPRGNDAEL